MSNVVETTEGTVDLDRQEEQPMDVEVNENHSSAQILAKLFSETPYLLIETEDSNIEDGSATQDLRVVRAFATLREARAAAANYNEFAIVIGHEVGENEAEVVRKVKRTSLFGQKKTRKVEPVAKAKATRPKKDAK
jgi:hypothetical protein